MSIWQNMVRSMISAESPTAAAYLYGNENTQTNYSKPKTQNETIDLSNLPYYHTGISKRDPYIIDDYIADNYNIYNDGDYSNFKAFYNPKTGESKASYFVNYNDGDYSVNNEGTKYDQYGNKVRYLNRNFYGIGPTAKGMYGLGKSTQYQDSEQDLEQNPEVVNEKQFIPFKTYDDPRAIQHFLNTQGYNLALDGKIGKQTMAAIKDWQSKNGLTADGLWGKNTSAVAKQKGFGAPAQPIAIPEPKDVTVPAVDTNPKNEVLAKVQGNATSDRAAQLMQSMRENEAKRKAELEGIMQNDPKLGQILNADPHNIQGGYVVPKEEPLDYSKLQTHTTDTNPFGFITADPLKDASKFYQKGGEVKEKPQSISTSGYFLDENGNPVVQNVDMVSGKSKDDKNRWFQRIITQRDSLPADTVIYDFNRRIPTENPDSNAYYNAILEEMLKRSEPIAYKKGGSLKKCSCGCKTLLKRGKGGKVMESKNCK